MGYKRASVFLSDQERNAIRILRERYGLSTDSDVVRMALNVLASNPILQIQLPKPLKPGPKPKEDGNNDESIRL